jgi:hypothetical protein
MAFDIMTDETFLFSVSLSATKLKLFKQDATDGSVANGFETSNFYSHASTRLSISSDNQAVFISALKYTSNDATLWKWSIGGTDFQWVSYSNYRVPKAVIPIDSNMLVFIMETSNPIADLAFK